MKLDELDVQKLNMTDNDTLVVYTPAGTSPQQTKLVCEAMRKLKESQGWKNPVAVLPESLRLEVISQEDLT